MVNTGSVTSWLQLSTTPDVAQRELVESTARAGDNWAGLGVRVNSVLPARGSVLPRQYAPSAPMGGSRAAGGTLVRTPQPRVGDAVADATLFLASSAAARITGQTLRIS